MPRSLKSTSEVWYNSQTSTFENKYVFQGFKSHEVDHLGFALSVFQSTGITLAVFFIFTAWKATFLSPCVLVFDMLLFYVVLVPALAIASGRYYIIISVVIFFESLSLFESLLALRMVSLLRKFEDQPSVCMSV